MKMKEKIFGNEELMKIARQNNRLKMAIYRAKKKLHQEKLNANPELREAERESNRIRKAEYRAKKKRQLLPSDINADKLEHSAGSTVEVVEEESQVVKMEITL